MGHLRFGYDGKLGCEWDFWSNYPGGGGDGWVRSVEERVTASFRYSKLNMDIGCWMDTSVVVESFQSEIEPPKLEAIFLFEIVRHFIYSIGIWGRY